MTRTITAFFDDRSDAMQAVQRLSEAGIPRETIRILPENESDRPSGSNTASSSYDVNRDEKGFWESLGDMFFPSEDRYTYAEAMHRGDVMVTATVEDQYAEAAEDILEEDGTVNIDERETSWRNEGWTGWPDNRGADAQERSSSSNEREGVIPIVQEELRIGKRDVNRGSVKVRSYVVEEPVSEDVSLREESVQVERRPADRAMSQGEADDLFRERTIEVEERGEEAVVSKTARVREEVAVGKTVEERTETIRDNVRRTEVEVEDERNDRGSTGDGKRRAS